MKETGTRRQGSEKRGEKDGGQHISVKVTLTHNAHFVRARNQLETRNIDMVTEVMRGIWIACRNGFIYRRTRRYLVVQGPFWSGSLLAQMSEQLGGSSLSARLRFSVMFCFLPVVWESEACMVCFTAGPLEIWAWVLHHGLGGMSSQ